MLGFIASSGDRDLLTVETTRGAEQTISTGKYEVTGRGGKGRELLQRGQFTRIVLADAGGAGARRNCSNRAKLRTCDKHVSTPHPEAGELDRCEPWLGTTPAAVGRAVDCRFAVICKERSLAHRNVSTSPSSSTSTTSKSASRPPSASSSTSAPSSTPSRSAARSSPRSPTPTGRARANTAARSRSTPSGWCSATSRPGGDKNGADINLALDALEMAFTHPHINAYVIVGGDSDFLSLVEKLKQYDKKVFVVGGRAFTSMILQRNCHEFIAYENLSASRQPAVKRRPTAGRRRATSPIAQAFPIVRRALKILADREVSPQTGLLKSTLLQLDSTFSERNYGASSFLDFVEKLAQAGLVQLKHAGPQRDGGAERAFRRMATAGICRPPRTPTSWKIDADEPRRRRTGLPPTRPATTRLAAAAADQPAPAGAFATRLAGRRRAARRRHLRERHDRALADVSAKRQADPAAVPRRQHGSGDAVGFDERRYGFGGLMDLLRACQRERLVRLERDRRGGLRVFQGAALQRGGAPAPRAGGHALDRT